MEGVVIIFDIGPGVAQKNHGKCFLEEARKCVSKILQRKVFSGSKDEIALIVMGSVGTQNPLHDDAFSEKDYKHISVLRPLAQVDFDAVRIVEKDLEPSEFEADWIDALVIAADFFQRATKARNKYEAMKIVLMTDFSGPVNVGQLDVIVAALQSLDIQFMIVGANLGENDDDEDAHVANGDSSSGMGKDGGQSLSFIGKPKSKTQMEAEKVAREILSKVDGRSANFEVLDNMLQFYTKRHVRSGAWNANLEISPNFFVPVTGYYKIKEAKVKTWGNVVHALGMEGEKPDRVTSYHFRDEAQSELREEQIAKLTYGYLYGSSIVSFSSEDKEKCKYESEKAFQAVCFIKLAQVPWSHLLGDGTMYFVPRKDDENAVKAFTALAHAVEETGTAIIGRKVYRKGSNPQMGILFPVFKESGDVLAWIPLPYAEDIRRFKFPSLDSKEVGDVSQAEADLIDQLIDERDLSDEEKLRSEGKFTYNPKETNNPIMQRLYSCLTLRGLEPEAHVPEKLDEPLARMVEPEPSEALKQLGAKLAEAFPTVEPEKKNRFARAGLAKLGDGTAEGGDVDKVVTEEDDSKLDVTADDDPGALAFGESQTQAPREPPQRKRTPTPPPEEPEPEHVADGEDDELF